MPAYAHDDVDFLYALFSSGASLSRCPSSVPGPSILPEAHVKSVLAVEGVPLQVAQRRRLQSLVTVDDIVSDAVRNVASALSNLRAIGFAIEALPYTARSMSACSSTSLSYTKHASSRYRWINGSRYEGTFLGTSETSSSACLSCYLKHVNFLVIP